MIYGQPITLGGGDGLNIDYGLTPPTDTSKLWVPLAQKPANVEVSGDSLQNVVDVADKLLLTVAVKTDKSPVAEANGKIYIFGCGDTSVSNHYIIVQEFDPAAGTCVIKSGLTTGHYTSGGDAVSVNGKIYIIGSMDTDYGRKISEYDPATDTAVLKNAMSGSYKCAPAAIDGKIYFFGGTSSTGLAQKTVRVYDPVADMTSTLGSLFPDSISNAASVVINGKAYIFGGRVGSADSRKIFEYDPIANTVTQKSATLPNAIASHCAVALNGKAYIIGGYRGSTYYQKVAEYDPVTDTCIAMGATMPVAPVSSGAAVVGDTAYIIGGTRDAYAIQTYTPKAYLGANHLKLFASVYQSGSFQLPTNIVNGKSAQIKLFMTSAFLGDDDGYAMVQDAYVYDEENSEWQALDGTSMTTDMLAALAELGVT